MDPARPKGTTPFPPGPDAARATVRVSRQAGFYTRQDARRRWEASDREDGSLDPLAVSASGLEPAEALRVLSRSSEFLPRFAVVTGGGTSVAPMAAIDLMPSGTSWFPRSASGEPVEARLVARVVGHIAVDSNLGPAHDRADARFVPAFRGWSTVVLTSGRLAGICPRGEALSGPVDFDRGTVVGWSYPLAHVAAAGVVEASGRPVVAIRSTDDLVGGVMLESVHRVVDGRLEPARPDELAVALNTATRHRRDPASPTPARG